MNFQKLILICIINVYQEKLIYISDTSSWMLFVFLLAHKLWASAGRRPLPCPTISYLSGPKTPRPTFVHTHTPQWQFLATAPVRELFQSTQYMHIDWPNVTWLIGYYKIHHFIYRAVIRLNKWFHLLMMLPLLLSKAAM